MSAFMMSNETLSKLTNLFLRYHLTGGDAFGLYFPRELFEEFKKDNGGKMLTGESIFNSLAALNAESLKQRYTDGYEEMIGMPKYMPECDIWRHQVYDLHNGIYRIEQWHYQVLKSLDCYLYQSCEGDCYMRPLYMALERFRDKWGNYIASNQPEYELADWD